LGTEDCLAEKTVFFGFESTIVNGFGFLNLTFSVDAAIGFDKGFSPEGPFSDEIG
jgi:hypothetical protein